MKYMRQEILGFLFLITFLGGHAAAQADKRKFADLLLLHGRIYTSNPTRPWVQALAIRGENILAIGSNQEVEKFRGPTTRVIDLGDRMAMPGIIDSHIHFLEGSLSLDQVNLDEARSLPELKRRIREYAAAHPERKWVLGRGWFYDAFAPAPLPTKQLLDELIPDRPAVISCFDGHSVWVNSRALALAGITKDTPDPVAAGVKSLADARTGPRSRWISP